VIGDLKPYEDYADSGLPWLPRVPNHWRTLRNGNLFGQRVETGFGELPILEVSLKTGVRVRNFAQGGRKQVMADVAKYKRVAEGDLAYNTMRMWQGALGVCPVDGLVSPAYVVARPHPAVEPAYFAALFKTDVFMAEIDSASRGIVKDRNRLYWEQFKQMRVPCPPQDEQQAIVRFLGWAHGRLDRAIRAKRKVIALLNEQKQAIIQRAVTRGLNPDVLLKLSGVPDCPMLPIHWEVLPLKRVLRHLIDCEHKTAPFLEPSDFRVVRTSAVRNGALRLSGTYGTTPAAFRAWTRRGRPELGDVIFTREAPAGEACIVGDNQYVCLGQRTVLMKIDRHRLNAEYLVHSIYSGPPRQAITLASQGSTVGHFNMSDIGALTMFLPPLEEQQSIIGAIVQQTSGQLIAISR
jgi:type I restriction enzyme S subunit